jgi:hypothetical protein
MLQESSAYMIPTTVCYWVKVINLTSFETPAAYWKASVMNYKFLFFIITVPVLPALNGITHAQEVYKWTDARGQVHYSQNKPEAADRVQTLDIPPLPPTDPSSPEVDAEVARLNALSEEMAREREEAEKARQEQAIRDLEQKNKALENKLLKQELEQQQPEDDSDRMIIGYPPIYPYPPYYPPRPPHPPHHRPCSPGSNCDKPAMPLPSPKPLPKPAPLAKPNPPFTPPPAGLAPTTPGVFRGQ